MTNRFGVDTAYFRKELSKLSRDLDNYTHVELARYFEVLSDVAADNIQNKGSLVDDIQTNQVLAGEQAVIENLKRLGIDT